MELKKYEKSEEFDRNEAIYVLYTVDQLPMVELAQNFDLAIEDIQTILIKHKEYEERVLA